MKDICLEYMDACKLADAKYRKLQEAGEKLKLARDEWMVAENRKRVLHETLESHHKEETQTIRKAFIKHDTKTIIHKFKENFRNA